MKFSIKTAALATAVFGIIVPQTSFATNGAWLIGFGAKSRSMGGTGVADNRDAYAAAFNPATMADSGNSFYVGADLFMPPRSIKHESGRLGYTDEESNNNLFLIPSMGLTYDWNEKINVGFAFIGAGLQTEYNQTVNNDSCKAVNAGAVPGFTQCPPTVFNVLGQTAATESGVELIQMQFLPSISYKINDKHSVGFTLALGATFFRAKGLQDFGELGFTTANGDFTSGSWDSAYGAGIRLGWLGKFAKDDKLRFGVNYSSRVYMQKLDAYKNLFAEHGGFDIPESYSAGVAFDFTPAITATFDVQRINWSDVKSIGNPGPLASDPQNFFPLCQGGRAASECFLGQDDGLGFGWTNQTVYKVGVNWNITDKWSARAGWNYGKSPIPSDQVLFNMLAPATPEHHMTLGGGYEINDTFVVDASLVYAFSNTIEGPTAFGVNGATVTGTNASIGMKQLSIGGSLGIRF